jgi:crotonobetainyl-CoA:carnitine CoA-transferase CaiB-like acyl-CoA transferase
MTGWGQTGPLSQAAGHDLNYIALTGALNAFGRKEQLPVPPLNLLGDFAGGAAYLAFGMVCALLEAGKSGKGQVVDAAIVDGTTHLMTSAYGTYGAGMMVLDRGQNILDTGSFFYEVYTCSDGKMISIAPIEEKFYDDLLTRLGIDADDMPPRSDQARWEEGKTLFAQAFAGKTRDQWCQLLEGTDVCFAPVLTMEEAPHHPHMRERGIFVDIDGVVQPAPAPRFSRTIPHAPSPPRKAAEIPLSEALDGWMDGAEIEALRAAGLAIQL